jgi:hypothetical protein
MATGYGTYSTTTYSAHTDNMAVASADWVYELATERPDLSNYAPDQWSRPQIWGDSLVQLNAKTFLLKGMNSTNTDSGRLYGTIAGSTLTLYKDSTKLASVGSVTGSTFSAANSSGLAAHADWGFTLSGSPVATTTIVMRFTTLEIELERLRSAVADEVIRRMMLRPELVGHKPEYLRRLNDKTELEHAEVYAAMYLYFKKQSAGDPDDAKMVLMTMYDQMLTQEIARPLGWDESISVTETDTDVQYSTGGAMIEVQFI